MKKTYIRYNIYGYDINNVLKNGFFSLSYKNCIVFNANEHFQALITFYIYIIIAYILYFILSFICS